MIERGSAIRFAATLALRQQSVLGTDEVAVPGSEIATAVGFPVAADGPLDLAEPGQLVETLRGLEPIREFLEDLPMTLATVSTAFADLAVLAARRLADLRGATPEEVLADLIDQLPDAKPGC